MALDPTPWVIAGGAQHSADLARALAFAATSGAEGVVLPDSLKVAAFATAGGGVDVGPGAGLLLNRSPGAAEQTYVVRNASTTSVAIAPTGTGGGRSDLVIVRVKDPQYPPWPAPADPATAQYTEIFVVQGVPAGTTKASSLNLGYPAIALARVDLPASTTNVTNAMIVDVRKVAQPRRERMMMTAYPPVKDTLGAGSGPGFHNWPTHSWNIDIPDWATIAVVHGVVAGTKIGSTDPLLNGDLDFQLAVNLGGLQTEASQSEWLTIARPDGSRGYMRGDLTAGGTLAIGSLRGLDNQVLRFRGGIIAFVHSTAEIYVDRYSTLIVDLEFQERAI
jgi:hypothetical protein